MTPIQKPSDVFPECQPVLEVRDVPKAIDWYEKKLGFQLDFAYGNPPSYACVGRSFSGEGAATFLRFVAWYRERDEPSHSGWLAIYAGDGIDELFNDYLANGVTVSKPIANHDYGMREFEICDCNGHYLRFGCVIRDD